jgi:predicted ATPase
MAHLRSIQLKEVPDGTADVFPFSVPIIRQLEHVELDQPITFLVGENGSGKSTLLEGIAAAANLPTVGSQSIDRDETLAAQRLLARSLSLVWNKRVKRGFFLRAEDFFGFTKELSKLRAELIARLRELDDEYAGRSAWAKGLAQGPARGSLADMERRYGVNLDENSHGQSFLKLFQSRFVPGGLFLLDEPEAPLSPQSQLALLAMIGDMVKQDAQFVIATHSPILLGATGAVIYNCDRVPIERAEYDELDHVSITRDFLNNRDRYLRHLS